MKAVVFRRFEKRLKKGALEPARNRKIAQNIRLKTEKSPQNDKPVILIKRWSLIQNQPLVSETFKAIFHTEWTNP